MRLTLDRCLQCGTPVRPSISILPTYPDVAADGRFANTDYWFCSRDCYALALDGFVPARWHFRTESKNDPEIQTLVRALNEDLRRFGRSDDCDFDSYEYQRRNSQDKVNQRGEKWKAEKLSIRTAAQSDLRALIYREIQIEREKNDAKVRESVLKEQAKIETEQAKQQARLAAELLEQEAFEEKLKPRPIPESLRMQHTHILAPSGYGKTTLIQQLILNDLDKPNPPGYVIIDPKGEMVERLGRLAVFRPHEAEGQTNMGRHADRLVIVDLKDERLPQLNMFSMPNVEGRAKQRVLNNLIEALAYVFSSSKSPLTQRQSIPFSFVVKLVFFMGGNINTLADVLQDTKEKRRFAKEIAAFCESDDGAKRFFEHDFYEVGFKATKEQIRARLYEIISRPELMAMFGAQENKLSIFDCLQQGKIVLVNTARPMGAEASAILGRYMIALTINAAFSRYAIPKDQWRPAYLVIDEFQDFVDEEKSPEMLRLAREYNLGIVLAHQNMYCAEFTESIRNSISTNTTIKYCAGAEGADRSYMARDLRCEQEFFSSHTEPKNGYGHFACYVRGMGLNHPFIYPVAYGNVEARPQMPDIVYRRFRRHNGYRLSSPPTTNSNRSTQQPTLGAAIQVESRAVSPAKPPKRDEKLW